MHATVDAETSLILPYRWAGKATPLSQDFAASWCMYTHHKGGSDSHVKTRMRVEAMSRGNWQEATKKAVSYNT